jgi:membrane protease YdiL (CAAX protease family)
MTSEPEEILVNHNFRSYALLASGVLIISKLASYIILSSHQSFAFNLDFYLNIHSVIISWIAPISIVVLYEKRKLTSLGFTFGRFPKSVHVVLVVGLIVLPIVFLNFDRLVIVHVLEQVLFIAFAEEILWRGYFQKRISDWIGLHKGIILSSIVFGLGHIVSIYAIEGYLVPSHTLVTLAQTSIGGLIFGYLFVWSKSIWPGAFLHLFGNVFLSQFF